MSSVKVVLDTNVLYSGLYSDMGASYQLLMKLGTDRFEACVSVPLVLEYEQTLKSHLDVLSLSEEDVEGFLNFICKVCLHTRIYYLWRPQLRDVNDDMVLETAIAAGAESVITHNTRDFKGAEMFGIQILTPGEFLKELGD